MSETLLPGFVELTSGYVGRVVRRSRPWSFDEPPPDPLEFLDSIGLVGPPAADAPPATRVCNGCYLDHPAAVGAVCDRLEREGSCSGVVAMQNVNMTEGRRRGHEIYAEFVKPQDCEAVAGAVMEAIRRVEERPATVAIILTVLLSRRLSHAVAVRVTFFQASARFEYYDPNGDDERMSAVREAFTGRESMFAAALKRAIPPKHMLVAHSPPVESYRAIHAHEGAVAPRLVNEPAGYCTSWSLMAAVWAMRGHSFVLAERAAVDAFAPAAARGREDTLRDLARNFSRCVVAAASKIYTPQQLRMAQCCHAPSIGYVWWWSQAK